jgi:tetratricopeptide (TPR) repeat protein
LNKKREKQRQSRRVPSSDSAKKEKDSKNAVPSARLNVDRRVFFGLTLIALAIIITYGNTLHGEFIRDDKAEILQNPYVRDFSYAGKLFSEPAWGFGSAGPYHLKSSYYRPVQYLSYSILFHIFGQQAWGYHLYKLVSHILVCGLLFWILLICCHDYFIALFSSLLFAVHPGNTEAVTWISGITDTNCGFFFLLGFLVYLKDRVEPSLSKLFLLSFLFFLGLMSKETMAVFLAVIFIYDWLETGRTPPFTRQLRLYLPLLGVFGVYLLLRIHAIEGFTDPQQIRYDFLDPFQVFLNQLLVLSRYIFLFFFPVALNAHHLFEPLVSPLNKTFGMALLVLTGTLVFFSLAFRRLECDRRRALLLGLLWFVITLLPVLIFLKRIGENIFAERYFYLPSMGICLSFCATLTLIKEKFSTATIIVFAILLGGLSLRSIERNRIWQNELVFYETTAKASPNAAVILNGLGTVYSQQGRYQDAMKVFEVSLANRSTTTALRNLGYIYGVLGRYEDSVSTYKKSIATDPMDAGAYSALGDVLVKWGKYTEAIANYQKALDLYPESTVALFKYAEACMAVQHFDEAIQALQKVISVSPAETASAYKMLAKVYEATNQPKLAEEATWKATVGPVQLIR